MITIKKVFLLVNLLIITLSLNGCKSYKIQPISNLYSNFSTCYNIFPISYADSNNDGYGDLNGIKNNLDYLNDGDDTTTSDLGIDCIWLNPINPSYSYHKYDVIDFYQIDPTFGTIDDFKSLLSEAKKRNIAIIMDFVINHSSVENEWFKKSKMGDKKYKDWYRWRNEDDMNYETLDGWVQYGDKYYFASFYKDMPELNYDNKEVRNEIKKIAKYWLNMGVDGFRIDAAYHIYDVKEYPKGTNILEKNLNWFKEFNSYIKSVKKDAIIVSEIWQSSSTIKYYYQGMDSAFNFDLSKSIISGVKDGDATDITRTVLNNREQYFEYKSDFVDSIFLSNHDMNRTMSEFNGSFEHAKLGANILFTLPGVSWVYYGEELGMEGKKPDEYIREPFIWALEDSSPNTSWETSKYNLNTNSLEIQKNDPNSIFNTYKTLIQLKKHHLVLQKGDFKKVTSKYYLMSFTREYEGEKYFIIHNLSNKEKSFIVEASVNNIIYNSNINNKLKDNTITMQPFSTIIIDVTGNVKILD